MKPIAAQLFGGRRGRHALSRAGRVDTLVTRFQPEHHDGTPTKAKLVLS